jgi:hypothetical protein
LHPSDDRPQPSGRPSLLTPDQQGEPAQERILSGLDGKKMGAAPFAAKRRSNVAPWLVTGTLVLAVCAGALVWFDEQETFRPHVAVQNTPVVQLPPPEPVITRTASEEIAAAAILEESFAEDGATLAEMEGESDDAPMMAELTARVPARKAVQAKKKAPRKVAVIKPAKKEPPKKLAVAPPKKKVEVQAKPTVQADNDVALLAALVAHSKVPQARKASSAAEKLTKCKTLGSVAEAEECRARLCSGEGGSEAECKAPPLAEGSVTP